jgi:hypothetical protein
MATILARIVLSLALLLQGVGAMAAAVAAASHAPCHHASGDTRKPARMACCHCDECTLSACTAGCAFHGASFAAVAVVTPAATVWRFEPARLVAPTALSPDLRPPLRPPIA